MPNPYLDRLMDLFHRAPREVIYGVVHPSGVGAGKSGGELLWHMTFSLAAWARPDGPLRKEKLLVRRDIDECQLKNYRERLPDFGVVAMEAAIVEESDSGKPQALLYTLLPDTPERTDLSELAEDLRKPVTTEDEQFGTFTLDRTLNWHEAMALWRGISVRLNLDSYNDDETFPCESLEHAKTLWLDQERWDREIRDSLVKELLDLKNGSWLDEDELELNAEEFLRRVSLTSITVRPGGSFEFWYDDGDLFWGHSIMASCSFENGIGKVGIHG